MKKPQIYFKLRFCITLTLLFLVGGISLHAQASDTKVVRVGWFESPFSKTDAEGNRSGYAYEYQLKVGAIAGWTYDYVEGTWPDLLDKLRRGEIDLLSDVATLESRKNDMLFSEREMAYEEYLMMVPKTGSTIEMGKPESVNGKQIGIEKGSVQISLFKEWQKENGVNCTIIEMNADADSLMHSLILGKIDGLVAPSSIDIGQFLPAFRIGSADVYFAINKSKPELKIQLDDAMEQIHTINPSFLHQLSGKYHSNYLYNIYLSGQECQWLEEHNTIRIGYRDNYLPFCSYNEETGNVEGLLQDFIEQTKGIFENAEFKIEAIPYPSISDAVQAVKLGQVDAAFPHGVEYSDAEKEGLILVDPLYNSIEMAVIRKGDVFNPADTLKAGLNNNNPNYLSLLHIYYPHWTTVNYSNTPDCLKGIAKGEADLMLLSSYRLGVLAQFVRNNKLKAVPTGRTISYGFVTKNGNTEVHNILNRLTDMMDENYIQSSIVNHSDSPVQTTTLEFIEQHMIPFFVILLTITTIILLLLYRATKERKKVERLSLIQKNHIDEIHSLNVNLEEHQAQLEEITAEQEAQIEEIHSLNHELEEAKEEADAANAAKSSFLFNMSHDIRTPMNAIIGFTNLLKKHQDEPERRADYLEKIEGSSNILLSIINNVLEMARIEKGNIDLVETSESVEQFNGILVSAFSEMMNQKNLTFTHSIDIQHHRVFCDTTKLREIFFNLLSNACKYTPEGGSVSLDLAELPSDREGYTLFRATVSDTGIGMSEEYLPHVFEEFSRENTTTDNKIEGTGLGMPIVKRLVEMMNGTIEVKSQKGVGTSFIVTVPFRIAEESIEDRTPQVKTHSSNFVGKRILLAEDNDLNAEIAIELLSELGFILERAEDGKRAVEMIQQAEAGHYDVILMDVQMPNMNGYEATRSIRQLSDTAKANIPILAMTANAFEEDRSLSMDAGMNGHLAKPIDMTELTNSLATILQ